MNVVDALSSLSLVLSLKTNTGMQSEYSPSSSLDEDVNNPISANNPVTSNTSLDVSCSHNRSSARRRFRPFHRSSLVVKHGLASMRRHRVRPATSRTNGYPKLTKEMQEKEKHDLLHHQLEEQVRQLKSKQDNLLTQIEYLYLYKHHLKVQCQESTSDYKLQL